MCEIMKNFAAPAATILAALVAVSVTAYFAWHQRNIARDQAFIAKEKFRHDLFDRRYAIFESIFDFYNAMISWEGTADQVAARTRFFRAYHESEFLFRKESGITELLKGLNDAGNKVIGYKETSENYKSDPQMLIKLHKETTEIMTTTFEQGLMRLKQAMAEYLNFHDTYPDK